MKKVSEVGRVSKEIGDGHQTMIDFYVFALVAGNLFILAMCCVICRSKQVCSGCAVVKTNIHE